MAQSCNYFCCVFLILLIENVSCDESSVMTRTKLLRDRIFKDYDKLVRPVNGTGNITHVRFSIRPRFIVEVDEDHMLFKMDSWILMRWTDSRLSWDASEQIDSLKMPIDTIWRPDISMYNSHSESVDPFQEVMAFVKPGGVVFWVTPATTATHCDTAGKDEVTCEMEFGSWTTDGWTIDLDVLNSDVNMNNFRNLNPRWDLKTKEVSITRKVEKYDCCDEPYHCIHILFPMVRRPSPQLSTVRTACLAAAALVLALLWVPPQEYSTRVVLGALLFLALSLLMLYASMTTGALLPTARDAVLLSRSMSAVVTFILVMQVVTMRLSRCTGPSRPNPSLILLLSGSLLRYACLQTPGKTGEHVTARDEWRLVATAIDRLLFLACVPAMVMLLLLD